MSLLNTAEIRPSVMVLIARFLKLRDNHTENIDTLVNTVSPPGLTSAQEQQTDVRSSLEEAISIGIVDRDGETVQLTDKAAIAIADGTQAFVRHVRALVLSEELNKAPWGTQTGARELTTALAWFLTLPTSKAPVSMEGTQPAVATLQTEDFGDREKNKKPNWPIGNDSRFQAFRRWAPSLGFAWVDPTGRVIPDPTPAIRDALPEIFESTKELTADAFVDALGNALPVLDGGECHEFVQQNWVREPSDLDRLTEATSNALDRLKREGILDWEHRADAKTGLRRFAESGTFSHVTLREDP